MIAGNVLPAIISIIILVITDQLSKYFIVNKLELDEAIPVIDGVFEIRYIRNAGAAWGVFQNKQIIFYIITVIALSVCIYSYIKCLKADKYRDIKVLIIMIMAGAIGNFIDRVRLKYVIDFLYFKLINFPIFNVADCYITIGVFVLLFLLIFKYKEEDFNAII
ncbi:MAG: signal peptidase II [Lachnospiraceae bacterium]|nr:signal peptidase II [Lachnospiraceae bacterium]